jgi:hypothetical protein
MLGSAIVYSFVMLGPWGMVKEAANAIGSLDWVVFSLILLVLVLVILPGILYLGLKIFHSKITNAELKREFIHQSYGLIPLGLAAWIAFSFSFIFTNFSYVTATISDPFGWGWNLFGTAEMGWTPYLSAGISTYQVIALLAGLLFTILSSQKIAGESKRFNSSLPTIGMSTILTIGQLWILVR